MYVCYDLMYVNLLACFSYLASAKFLRRWKFTYTSETPNTYHIVFFFSQPELLHLGGNSVDRQIVD